MLRLAVDAFVRFGMPNCQKSKRAQNGPYLATFGLLTGQMVIYMDQLDRLTASRTLWSHSKYFCHVGGQKSTKNVILRCKFAWKCIFWGGRKSKKRQWRSNTKLKSYVNYQMSHSVVQENNNGNSKIFNNLAKNFVYFLSVFMKDPVPLKMTIRRRMKRI